MFGNIDFFIALINVKFLNFLFFNFLNLDKILIVLSNLSLPSQTILLLLALNIFKANF